MRIVIACTLIVLINGVFGQDPIVKIDETSPVTDSRDRIVAKRDQDVTMDCYVENLPQGNVVRWHRIYTSASGKEQIQDISENEGATDNTKHGIEKPTQFTWRLRVKSIKVADEGTYECYVQVIRQSKVLDRRQIIVMIPPTLDPALTSTDTTVKEGDTVDLMCNATGRPTPMIEWTRQGGALLPVGMEKYRGSKLPIPNVRYQDRGVYMCDVFNEIGKDRREITLSVRFKPQITIHDAVITQAVGYQIELQCFVDANPYPKPENIKWVKGALSYTRDSGRFIVKQVRGAFNKMTFELIITNVQPEDYGTYSCQVSNNEGTSSKKITLKETENPQKSRKLGVVIKAGATCISHNVLIMATLAFITIVKTLLAL